MAIWDPITRPIRGIGRLLRGKFKQGLGDIGAGAKGLAPLLALTGVGAPLGIGAKLALAIGAGGGALEGATTGGGGIGNALKGAAGGAARTGLALGGKALATKYLGGGGGAGGVNTYDPNVAVQGTGLEAASSGGSRGIGRLLDAGKDVAGWAEKHPTLTGAALSAYGDYEERESSDRMAQLEEDDLRRGWDRQDNLDPILADLINRLINNTATVN